MFPFKNKIIQARVIATGAEISVYQHKITGMYVEATGWGRVSYTFDELDFITLNTKP